MLPVFFALFGFPETMTNDFDLIIMFNIILIFKCKLKGVE